MTQYDENEPSAHNESSLFLLKLELDEVIESASHDDSISSLDHVIYVLGTLYEGYESDGSNDELEAVMQALSDVIAFRKRLHNDDISRAIHTAEQTNDKALLERDKIEDEGVMTYVDDTIDVLEHQFNRHPSQNE